MSAIASRQRPTLASVVSKGTPMPDRIVLYADPGWGKSSFAARLPKPVFLTTPGENRLDQLIQQGLIPQTPHFPDEAQSWDDVTAAIDELIRGQSTMAIGANAGSSPFHGARKSPPIACGFRCSSIWTTCAPKEKCA